MDLKLPNLGEGADSGTVVNLFVKEGDTITKDQMYDAADSILGQKLSQIEGVGQVFIWGASQPAVRIEANPLILNRMGLGLEAVRTAIVGGLLFSQLLTLYTTPVVYLWFDRLARALQRVRAPRPAEAMGD